MNIKGFLIICICSISTISFSQIEFTHDTLYTEVTEIDDIVAKNFFKNKLPQNRVFKWTRNIIEMTEGWDNAVCDNNTCYIPSVGEAEVALGPNASSILDLHVYPNGQYIGYAAIEMTVADLANPSFNVIAYYFYDSSLTNTDEPAVLNVKLYPNPTQGLLTIEDEHHKVKSLKVMDPLGRVQANISIGSGQMINLAGLASGNYIVQMYGENHVYLGHKLMIKQ